MSEPMTDEQKAHRYAVGTKRNYYDGLVAAAGFLAGLDVARSECKDEIENLKKENSELRCDNALNEAITTIEGLKAEIDDCNKRHATEVKTLQDKLQVQHDEIGARGVEIGDRGTKIKHLEAEVDKLNKELQQGIKWNESLAIERDELSNEVLSKDKLIKDMTYELLIASGAIKALGTENTLVQDMKRSDLILSLMPLTQKLMKHGEL